MLDLVMWTKNGEKTLPHVLGRINQVIPNENVGNRIVVDDASVDGTKTIAKIWGWKVVDNEGSGISDGANTALKHVKTEYFASFEQDVLLNWDWWQRMLPLLKEKKIAVVSGVRLPGLSQSLLKISEHSLEKAKRLGFPYFKTLDNTIYKTSVIRGLGGFPKAKMAVDTVLAKQIKDGGFKWVVDANTVSLHLKDVMGELKSQYFYGKFSEKHMHAQTVMRVAFSPIRGLEVAYKKKCWKVAFVYPLLRLSHFLGVLRGIL